MDFLLLKYTHTAHFPHFWELFCSYWQEVNGGDLNKLHTIYDNERFLVTSLVESKILDLIRAGHQIKVLADGISDEIVGFIQYKAQESGALFVHAMYLRSELRGQGHSPLLFTSLPTKKILFHTRLDNPPNEFFTPMLNIERVSDDGHLVLWKGEIT